LGQLRSWQQREKQESISIMAKTNFAGFIDASNFYRKAALWSGLFHSDDIQSPSSCSTSIWRFSLRDAGRPQNLHTLYAVDDPASLALLADG
jgi:hypothetical protein